jgi:D-threonate/D-erythronate kinase
VADLVVFADDLTGALDTGVAFAGGPGMVAVTWRSCLPDAGVAVLDTETRLAGPAAAIEGIRGWARLIGDVACESVYKKMDSTLRGPFAAEANALADCLGCKGFLVAAASPATGRTVVNGHLLVKGVPVEQTAFAVDPLTPILEGDVASVVLSQTGQRPALLSLAAVRAGARGLASRLAGLSGAVVADGENEGDLHAVARAAADSGGWLLVGSAGLATALAQVRGWPPPAPSHPSPPQLYVCGSLNPVSSEQVGELCRDSTVRPIEVGPDAIANGLELMRLVWQRKGLVVLTPPSQRWGVGAMECCLRQLAALSAQAVCELGLTRLFVTGGTTLMAVADALGLMGINPQGEVAPGVVYSLADLPGRRLEVVSKAGGFGSAGLLAAMSSLRHALDVE